MLNMDFTQSLWIDTEGMDWVQSPSAGVFRKPLEREAAESGHVSSIVKFEAGCSFPTHEHPLGEEIFVLEGTFSDENGDYSAGSYLRHPPKSKHAPFSKEGCTIFVKLNQFDENDLKSVHIQTRETPWLAGIGNLQVMPLHDYEGQHTALVKWPAGEVFQPHRHFGGEEILVLSGTFRDEHGIYPKRSWLRSPHLSQHYPFVEEETIILVKTGHLPF